MTKTVTWLHLSDLHVCNPKFDWDYHRVLNSLLEDLQRMQNDHGLHPDLIFFTGDIGYGQIGTNKDERLSEQLNTAQKMFDQIRKKFTKEVPFENFFLVPGNHDVNRNKITTDLTEWIDKQQDYEAPLRMIVDADKQWQRFMERLSDYRNFLVSKGYKHLLTDPERLIYAAVRDVGGGKIGIAGLNSAWSCGRNDEKGKIWLGGFYQINYLKKELKSADICISLCHHPINWLVQYEDPIVGRKIEQDYRFFLHGHEHGVWVHEAKDHIRIASAACYNRSDKENGYNFVRLNLDNGTGEVWLREYDSAGDGWVPRTIGGGRTDDHGKWLLDNLNWLKVNSKTKHIAKSDFAFKQSSTKESIEDIWSFGEETPTLINIVAADTRRRIDLPDKHYPDYSLMEFLGDKDSIVEVSMQLSRLYPHTNIARYPSSEFPKQARSAPLVIIGGPRGENDVGGNQLTDEVLKYWGLPIKYTEDLDLVIGENTYRSEYDEQDNIIVDYGVLTRVPNPWDPKRRILVIQGIHTYGVLGATLAIINSDEGKENTEMITKVCGIDPIFYNWCKVPVVAGLALVPKFELKNIVPLDF